MKRVLLAVMTLPMVLRTVNTPLQEQTRTSSAAAKKSVVFACNMKALAPAQRKRQSEVLAPALIAAKRKTSELSDGYAFQFAPDAKTFATLSEWIGNERLCCPFFEFDLHAGDSSTPTVLRITGPEGVKQFIRAELSEMVS